MQNVQTGPDGLRTPIELDRAERLLIERRRAFRVMDDEVRDNPADRRTRHVHLTKEGQTVVASLRADMERAQERMLAPLRPAQRKVFMELLSTLVEANNDYSRTVLRIM